MTGAEFSGVDHDLLADYVGGALAGTPDEAVVAALIAGDPAWRAAHDELVAALAAVGADLAALAASPEPMPADVVARLDAAFTPPVAHPAATDPHLVPAGAGSASGRHLVAVPDGGVDRAGGKRTRPAARDRHLRWAAPLAAAAGVLAFAAVGITYLAGQSRTTNDRATSSAAGGAAESAPMLASEPASGLPEGARILASGRNYRPATLPEAAAQTLVAPEPKVPSRAGKGPEGNEQGPADDSRSLAEPVLPALERLRATGALRECLDSIAQENSAGTISVQIIDYARYSGNPALVVRFTAANGSWVWASGPDCGTPGVGSAKLAAVQVG